MSRKIEKAAVLGAGIMGSGIAAHLANCGIKTYLLDIVPPELTEDDKKKGWTKETPAFRNKFSRTGLENAIKNKKPIPAFYHDRFADLVTTGNLEDNLNWLEECDWVVEVVVENIDIKRKLFTNVEKHMKSGAIISSNTSGLPIKAMTEGRSSAFKKHFLVTHFFNPVRFMHILELIPGPDTDPEIMAFLSKFGTDVLGKGVVYGYDTPNFVGNRIGVYAIARTVKEMIDKDYTIEEVDAIVGEPMGRPKTGAFRTADMVGLDTLDHILRNTYEALKDDEGREVYKAPEFFKKMVEKKLFGDKTGGGFYKKQKGGEEAKTLVMDWKTGEYRDKQKVRIDSIGAAKNTENLTERVKNFVNSDDRAGTFAWTVFADCLIYSGNRVGEITDDIVQIDNSMKWGYNWSMGPFEAWDAVGVKEVCERMKKDGKKVPAIAEALLASGGTSFYKSENGKRSFFDLKTKKYKPYPEDPKVVRLPALREMKREIAGNTSATLLDMGDGVLCCEFHTKMNAIDDDIVRMLDQGMDLLDKDDKYVGMVLGNNGDAFCAGANVMMLLMHAREKHWAEIEQVVKALQDTNMRMKYSKKPVVAAPFGMVLGGGMEITTHASRVCAHADLFMGLVEIGVGLIPAGGGCKELTCRFQEGIPDHVQSPNMIPLIQAAFESIGMAKVTMSAHEAVGLKYLKASDKVVTNRDQLHGEAKRMVLAMSLEGYTPPVPKRLRLPGEHGYATLRMVIDSMEKQHQIFPHEKTIATKLAWVLCGGKTTMAFGVPEQYLLDLEREAFMYLIGTEQTQARIEHFLLKGKPLRN